MCWFFFFQNPIQLSKVEKSPNQPMTILKQTKTYPLGNKMGHLAKATKKFWAFIQLFKKIQWTHFKSGWIDILKLYSVVHYFFFFGKNNKSNLILQNFKVVIAKMVSFGKQL